MSLLEKVFFFWKKYFKVVSFLPKMLIPMIGIFQVYKSFLTHFIQIWKNLRLFLVTLVDKIIYVLIQVSLYYIYLDMHHIFLILKIIH